MKFWAGGVLAIALAACASKMPLREVEVAMFIPSLEDKTELKKNEAFVMPMEIDVQVPIYPTSADGNPSVTICAEIVISEFGDVKSVELIESDPGCEPISDNVTGRFGDAVLEAAKRWKFIAAGVCKFQIDQSECDSPSSNIRAIPVKLAYKFRFSESGVTSIAD